jgi:peptidoglycan/xylan/chitin deacetylase (PgdA/CDA1 family)
MNGMRPPRAAVRLLRRLRATRTGVPAATALAALALLCGLALGIGGAAEDGIPALQAATAAPALGPDMAASRTDGALRRQRARERQAIARTLARTPFIARGGTRRREVALTFDDGPGPETPRIMRVLRRARAPATFFFVGQQLDFFGSMLRSEARRGFAIGDHTQNHAPLGLLPAREQRRQLVTAARHARRYGVEDLRFFRPPYGSYNRHTLQVGRALGMLMVLWTIDTGDFRRPGVRAIVKAVLSRARPGAIVLMHDGGGPRRQTAQALPVVIRRLRHRGYRLVTVPQLLAEDPPSGRQAPPPGIGQPATARRSAAAHRPRPARHR